MTWRWINGLLFQIKSDFTPFAVSDQPHITVTWSAHMEAQSTGIQRLDFALTKHLHQQEPHKLKRLRCNRLLFVSYFKFKAMSLCDLYTSFRLACATFNTGHLVYHIAKTTPQWPCKINKHHYNHHHTCTYTPKPSLSLSTQEKYWPLNAPNSSVNERSAVCPLKLKWPAMKVSLVMVQWKAFPAYVLR